MQPLNIYKQQFYMTFLHQKLAILGLLWSIATAASYGQAIAGIHSKHPVLTSQRLFLRKQTPLFSNKGWTTFADSLGAFSIELPNYPKRKTFKNNSLPPYEYDIMGLKAHLFTSEDRAGNAYMIRYHDLPADKEFTDLNAFFKENLSELWQGQEPNILIFNNLAMNGYAGRYVVYEVQNI